jgi:Tfp pilus assembly pilus retraction ATPase PilT
MFSSEDVSRFKFDLASNLKAVLSQRLVLTADKHSRVAIREVMLVGAAERKCIMNFDIEGLSAMMMEQHKDMDWILGVQAGNGVLDMDSALATAADQPRFFEGYKSVSSL